MALVNTGYEATAAWASVYTVPSGQQARVTQLQAAGIVAADATSGTLDVRWRDSSDSNAERWLVRGVVIPHGTAISCVTGELVLDTGDSIEVKADIADAVAVTFSAELI